MGCICSYNDSPIISVYINTVDLSLSISPCRWSQRWIVRRGEEGDKKRGAVGVLVTVETSVVSQLPICGLFEMLTSAFFHVHYNSPLRALRPALDCFIYPDAPVVKRMLRVRQCEYIRGTGKGEISESEFSLQSCSDLFLLWGGSPLTAMKPFYFIIWHVWVTPSLPRVM